MSNAKKTQALLEDPESELKQTWTRILKTVGERLERVRLLSYGCNDMRRAKYLDTSGKVDVDMPWQLPRHEHKKDRRRRKVEAEDEFNEDTVEYICQQATAVAGDKLLTTVITCLAASGVAIPHLIIQIFMMGDFVCKEIPGWDQLDFSALTNLQISPEIPSGMGGLVEENHHDYALVPGIEAIKKKAGDIFHDLIGKCHSSIRHLAFGTDWTGKGALAWPTRPPTLDFPELQHFTQKIYKKPRLLGRWVLQMRNLRCLELGGDLCQGEAYNNWRFVFNGIRDHPNVSGPSPKGLRVKLDAIQASPSCILSYNSVVCTDSSMVPKRHERDTGWGWGLDLHYPLEAYFYGEVPIRDNYWMVDFMDGWDVEEDEHESLTE
ncbi:hypothetical protein IL306_007062 [Fusarium sp. DS 682]|nr:hypothetical protein IL306_007062 [Fusarium sp. DS 682]